MLYFSYSFYFSFCVWHKIWITATDKLYCVCVCKASSNIWWWLYSLVSYHCGLEPGICNAFSYRPNDVLPVHIWMRITGHILAISATITNIKQNSYQRWASAINAKHRINLIQTNIKWLHSSQMMFECLISRCVQFGEQRWPHKYHRFISLSLHQQTFSISVCTSVWSKGMNNIN